MRTAKINSSHSSPRKLSFKKANTQEAQNSGQMCPPVKRTGFVKVKKSTRTSGGGGYATVAYGLATDEKKPDLNTGSSYSDFIHFNYGAASERARPSDPDNA
ncbi:hypothetical protein GCM10027443_37230 [Pontibacter brevis]